MSKLLHPVIGRHARISECGRYRYTLHRWWQEKPLRWIMWVMLNPSTADANIDDPTIRRCLGFSQAWGYDGMMVCNLFAYRSTDPDELRPTLEYAGVMNGIMVQAAAPGAELIVCAWGGHRIVTAEIVNQTARVIGKPLHALALTKGGQPRHPLYLPEHLQPQPFQWVSKEM